MIAVLSDAGYAKCLNHIEHYQLAVGSKNHEILKKYDKIIAAAAESEAISLCEKANAEVAQMLKEETQKTLDKVLYETSCLMKNSYARSDA